MRRRELLGACAGWTAILAGCVADPLPSSDEEPRHPFADRTVTVRIDDRSDTDHDVGANAREALGYWEDHAERYAGFGVEFEVVADEPELTIAYVDSPELCRGVDGFSERVLGCAPLLAPSRRVPDEVTAYVVAGARPFGQIRTTTKHEIGHVLGLSHDAEPREIMSNRPEDRIPLYEVRIEIWEGVLEAHDRSNDGTRLFSRGIGSWNEGQYGAAEAAFADANGEFVAARERIDAARDRTGAFDDLPEAEETVALGDLRAHLTRLRERIDAAVQFTRRMTDASAAGAAGDDARANDHLSAARDSVREFNELGPVELRDVAVALGLVRGFDRDDPVVDADDEDSHVADADDAGIE